MRTQTALAIAVATFAGGCASGSGGGGGGGGGDAEAYACLIAGPFCPFILAEPAAPTTSAPYIPSTAQRFESWSVSAAFEGWRWAAVGVGSAGSYGLDGDASITQLEHRLLRLSQGERFHRR